MIKKILVIFFVVYGVLTLNAQNIGLNKSYKVSALPNYYLTAKGNDTKSLTDGVYTKGQFWSQPTTVGWQGVSNITITIDLDKIENISEVHFNTAARQTADVYLPSHIYIYLSNDNEHFVYGGDIQADIYTKSAGYEVKMMVVKDINQTARYVRLTIIPNGPYLFCDEIEIIRGFKKTVIGNKIINTSELKQRIYFKENLNFIKEQAFDDVKKISNSSRSSTTSTTALLFNVKKQINDPELNYDKWAKIQSMIGKHHAQIIRAKLKLPFVVEKYDSWDNLNVFRNPLKNNPNLSYNYIVPVNGVQYGAFIITSACADKLLFNIKPLDNKKYQSITLFKTEYLPSRDFKLVPDALIPVSTTVNLSPGVATLFIFKLKGKAPGTGSNKIVMASSAGTINITIKSNVRSLFSGTFHQLNTINWSYLTNSMIIDKKAEAVNDLTDHHINTIVVPSHLVPPPGDYNFKNLINYLSYFPSVKNILLFSNYASANNRYINKNVVYLSSDWKTAFMLWYKRLLNEIGLLNKANVYLYPYDEVENNDIKDFVNFSIWGKANVKGLKLFGTFQNNQSADLLLPYMDVAQVLSDIRINSQNNKSHTEIWIYKTHNNTTALSPVSYYRLMAWEAYLYNFKGIGFWNYADVGSNEKYNPVNNNMISWKDEFAVIYNDSKGNLLSSRRWEAFKLGIEDYSILEMYGKKFGVLKAQGKIRDVVNSKNNGKLDSIRFEMVKEL